MGRTWGNIGRGAAGSIAARLSHSAIYCASLSRRGTGSTPNKDTFHISALVTFFCMHETKKNLLMGGGGGASSCAFI